MDQNKFDEAQKAYDAGNYRESAKGFLSAVGRGSEGNGAAYHYAGNSLMRLRRWRDAVTVYGHALRDQAYTRRGAVYSNLGQAHSQLGEYASAVDAYEHALQETDYKTQYKAHQGIAAAFLEMGKVEEAAVEYRKAALDADNPDPGKALLNLGLCFMALQRPEDAVESYKAALGFDNYQGRGKALANLGQAYVVLGRDDEAVAAFQRATELHGYQLSEAARADFEAAQARLGPPRETVDGWETGQMPPVIVAGAADAADAVPAETADADHAAAAAERLGFGGDEDIERFFSRTEEEMREADREARRAERAVRAERTPRDASGSRKLAMPIVTSAIAVALVVGLFAALYAAGFGWPTQGSTTKGLLSAHASNEPVDGYWVAVPDKDVTKEMAKLPPVESFKIDRVQRGPAVSVAYITVTPTTGAPLHYRVTLQREGVGWRVAGVENDWTATGSP